MKFMLIYLALFSLGHKQNQDPETKINLEVLMGHWKLDLSPENLNDDKFALMNITSVGENSIEGEFYRNGVKMKEGRIKILNGLIYAALVSGDNSGNYNTSFYYKDGFIYGTTHSLNKDFLSVWIGQKMEKK